MAKKQHEQPKQTQNQSNIKKLRREPTLVELLLKFRRSQ